MSAMLELQKAVFATLSASPEVQVLVGPDRIFDHVPHTTPFPYVTFGRTAVYDWNTSTEKGDEHLFTLHVWSRGKGKAQAGAIMDALKMRLENVPPVPQGHHLVNLTLEYSEARFDEELDGYHGLLRYRAVTEPAT